LLVEGAGDLGGVAGDELGGVGVGGVHHDLDRGDYAAGEIATEVRWNDEDSARSVRGECLFGGLVDGPRDDMEGDGCAEGIDEVVGGGGGVEVLHGDGQFVDGE